MSESVQVDKIPPCDLCKAFQGKNDVPAKYDGKTIQGPWGYMCERHFRSYGVGLGTGRGQRLILRKDKAS